MAVHVEFMRLIRSSDEINCASSACAKVQPIFPPASSVERRHHQAAPPEQQKPTGLRPICPQPTGIYVPARRPGIPRLCQRSRRRKAVKPTTHDCNIARNVTRSRLGRSTISQVLIPPNSLPRLICYRRKPLIFVSWGHHFHATARSSRPNISWALILCVRNQIGRNNPKSRLPIIMVRSALDLGGKLQDAQRSDLIGRVVEDGPVVNEAIKQDPYQ